jgi:plastocyanin
MRGKTVRIVALAGTLLLVGAACGGDEGGGNGGGSGSADLVASGTAWSPTTVSVASGGDTITITNEDGFAHTFTLDDGSVDVDLPSGETQSVDVNVTADAPFHCEIHPSMTGTLTVS